jgi:hypothetical protein
MSLLDNVRQTLGDAANTARDVSQNLGAQAQAQINIKRLQLEVAKKLHELGSRTYEWHKGGNLVATGTVPRDVNELCHAIDDLNRQLADEERKLEQARFEAELRNQRPSAPVVDAAPPATVPSTPIPLPAHVDPASPPASSPTSAGAISTSTGAQTAGVYPPPVTPTTTDGGHTMNATTYGTNLEASSQGMVAPGTGITALGPDMPGGDIPVPGPDMPSPGGNPMPTSPMPGMPPAGPQNPDMPTRSSPSLPPSLPTEPTMPGQPQGSTTFPGSPT